MCGIPDFLPNKGEAFHIIRFLDLISSPPWHTGSSAGSKTCRKEKHHQTSAKAKGQCQAVNQGFLHGFSFKIYPRPKQSQQQLGTFELRQFQNSTKLWRQKEIARRLFWRNIQGCSCNPPRCGATGRSFGAAPRPPSGCRRPPGGVPGAT